MPSGESASMGRQSVTGAGPMETWEHSAMAAKPPLPLPDEIEEIIAFSEKLAEGIPEVRVDSYLIDGKVMFGEMTFYTWAGLIPFDPPEYDEILGSWINLPETKRTGETEAERA